MPTAEGRDDVYDLAEALDIGDKFKWSGREQFAEITAECPQSKIKTIVRDPPERVLEVDGPGGADYYLALFNHDGFKETVLFVNRQQMEFFSRLGGKLVVEWGR